MFDSVARTAASVPGAGVSHLLGAQVNPAVGGLLVPL